MEKAFIQQGNQRGFWRSDSRILVAVSTGVDSMVLLRLLQKAQSQVGFQLGVVHVNHGLRRVAQEEEAFLRKYCVAQGLPLYVQRWDDPPTVGIEAAARAFRYRFFQEVMTNDHYDCLMTAHHGDDQMETMLMKMVRDGQLQNAGGIRQRRPFAQGELLRPLLSFSKEQITAYAHQEGVTFYEDETNQLLTIQRNRLRRHLLPLLKQENPQSLAHFQQLSQQLFGANELVQEFQEKWFAEAVTQSGDGWQLAVSSLMTLSENRRYFALKYLLQQGPSRVGSEEQLARLLQLLQQEKPQWRYDLGENWHAVRSYESFKLQTDNSLEISQRVRLAKGASVFLSEGEWIGLLTEAELANLPEKVKNWSEIRQVLPLDFPDVVTLRKRKPGDRLQLTASLRKKVSRIFIDKKIPNEKRARSWLMEDDQKNLLAVLPIAFSYLSIGSETDKIHYILVYKYREKS